MCVCLYLRNCSTCVCLYGCLMNLCGCVLQTSRQHYLRKSDSLSLCIFVYICLSSFVWSTVCVYIYVCVIWIRYDGRCICWFIKALSKPTPTPPLVFGQPIWFSWRKRSTKSASICCGLLSSWWRNDRFFWFCLKQHFTTNKSTMTASKYWLWWQYSCS